ncbi:conserved hypothetical protein [Thiomonas sp. X19]|uniref:hypothetical protein n=1 Tax=Thiomonas sp. X19 TaxID=1050370 RepID=UPI000B6AF84C|nr:hypothetical protein [Thiomonas sp. X19]SCC93166.1 conserved hypothetical protein [Thiomonas sp. X19]
MNSQKIELARDIVRQHALRGVEDVLALLPRHMCHIVQESEVFGTYQPQIVRLSQPESEWERLDAAYRRYRDEIIPALAVEDYLRAIAERREDRLPCFCSEMSDVAGVLVHFATGRKVYAIRQIFVNYLYLPQRWHCVNALVAGDRIRYFDSSAYRQVLDREKRKLVSPSDLEGFNYADIAERFLVGKRWLQSEPFERSIGLQGGNLKDSFYPNPFPGRAIDEYLHEFC